MKNNGKYKQKISKEYKNQPSRLDFVICHLLNKDSGKSQQYVGFTYTKINGVYGYLGIDNNKVIFIYADERGVVMDWLDNYEIINEKLNI